MSNTKTILTLLLATGLTFCAQAQDNKTDKPATPPAADNAENPRARARERWEKFQQELNLTAEQKEKFQKLFQENMEKGRELRNDTSLSQEEKRAKFQEQMKSFEAGVKEILTAEQFEKWKKFREEARPGRRGQNAPQN